MRRGSSRAGSAAAAAAAGLFLIPSFGDNAEQNEGGMTTTADAVYTPPP